jgi:hypothetical protein
MESRVRGLMGWVAHGEPGWGRRIGQSMLYSLYVGDLYNYGDGWCWWMWSMPN